MAECFNRGSGDDVYDVPLELNTDIALDPTDSILRSG
jgi:hypothetical protein